VSSSVEKRDADGGPLTVLSCDDHQSALTKQMMDAGTRYSLFPVCGPDPIPTCDCSGPTAEDVYEQEISKLPAVPRFLLNAACIIVGLVMAPFFIVYFGGRWALGWRP